MLKKNINIDEVYDRFAVRIIYDAKPVLEKLIAWKIYSIVTDVYRPNPTRLRDWISTPKSNGYEALHITVVGPNKRWIEVQIRSTRMHEIAERGYAAHFKYKQGDSEESGIEQWLNRLKEVMENQDSNAIDFVDDFKNQDRIIIGGIRKEKTNKNRREAKNLVLKPAININGTTNSNIKDG